MKNSKLIIYGILITVAIFGISNFVGKVFPLNHPFLPYTFLSHSVMLILSILAILVVRNRIGFRLRIPSFKSIWKPILFALLATIVINISMTILSQPVGGGAEQHPAFNVMNPWQILIFVFFYASLAEEMLFRGFLLNTLKPIQHIGIRIFKRKLSLSVMVSAIAFGLAHLILLYFNVSGLFVMRVVVFTLVLGLIAGYYQEKHENLAYAIIVHMAGNALGVVGAFLSTLNVA